MIGGIVFVFVNKCPAEFIANTFFRNQFYLPIAPAEGLYLKTLDFKGYNNKKEIPEKLEFEEENVKKSMDGLEKEI
jgi:tRNA U38,U39,U40 pseudouridine synthase TruA